MWVQVLSVRVGFLLEARLVPRCSDWNIRIEHFWSESWYLCLPYPPLGNAASMTHLFIPWPEGDSKREGAEKQHGQVLLHMPGGRLGQATGGLCSKSDRLTSPSPLYDPRSAPCGAVCATVKVHSLMHVFMKAFACVTGPWCGMHPWLVLFVMEQACTCVKSTFICTYVYNLCVNLSVCEMYPSWLQTHCPLCPPPSAPMAAINMPGEEAWIRQADPRVPPGPIFRGKKWPQSL